MSGPDLNLTLEDLNNASSALLACSVSLSSRLSLFRPGSEVAGDVFGESGAEAAGEYSTQREGMLRVCKDFAADYGQLALILSTAAHTFGQLDAEAAGAAAGGK